MYVCAFMIVLTYLVGVVNPFLVGNRHQFLSVCVCFLKLVLHRPPHLVAEKTDGEKRKMKVDFSKI